MPAKNPRTNLTLPPDLDAILTDLSELQGVPKARIITEMLLEVQPILEQTRNALKAVKGNKEDALSVVREFAQSALLESSENLGNFAKEVKKL
jgi:hypothetical protein